MHVTRVEVYICNSEKVVPNIHAMPLEKPRPKTVDVRPPSTLPAEGTMLTSDVEEIIRSMTGESSAKATSLPSGVDSDTCTFEPPARRRARHEHKTSDDETKLAFTLLRGPREHVVVSAAEK